MGCVGEEVTDVQWVVMNTSSQELAAVHKGLVFKSIRGNLKCYFACWITLTELNLISYCDGDFVSRLSS